MKYFTIEELVQSSTAKRKKIDNTPNEEIRENLIWFIDNVLDPLREAWGAPIHVSSGYRCEKLNKAVNGSKTSTHMSGLAADLYVKYNMSKFYAFCREYFKHHDFDQCIKEPGWVHVGAKRTDNRNMFLKTADCKNYSTWTDRV